MGLDEASTGTLSKAQREQFQTRGWLLLEDAVDPDLLDALRRDMHGWIEQSRAHTDNYGSTINGRPRFDLDPTHSADHPGLRRVNAPVEISEAHLRAATDSRMVDAVADLIGPAIRFHHSKTNAKLPHTRTPVRYHQDFAFTPHSNDDLVTVLLMLDEVTEQNGCLEVVDGSHRGPIHTLWHDQRFTGAVSESVERTARSGATRVVGPAGSACLMHTRLLHGSAPNDSDLPRTLFICVYSAADAVPLSPNPMPSRFEGRLLRGRASGRVRSQSFELELPELLTGTSFFEQQATVD
ncbi:MAG: phytanoyl-CoA dioxygenase family protein [Gammaproteobacteria bacterium]|nr:phytanoyl-CoA dioxygenase family protein [Gammaproteobacteria bacterium]